MTKSDYNPLRGQQCVLCGRRSRLIASSLGVCGDCVRSRPAESRPLAEKAHAVARSEFGKALQAPRTAGGQPCSLCAQACQLGEGELGYCGLRTVRYGKLVHLAGTPDRGLLHWYRDPLPTNCVAMGVCAGRDKTSGHNLAVFYGSCSLDCLYCQNWHFRDMLPTEEEVVAAEVKRGMSAADLAAFANPRTYCVCFFGGDPASQMPHALSTAALLADAGITVCWETSGVADNKLMDNAVDLSLRSGGTVKFDLKAYSEDLHIALTSTSNRRTLMNFTRAAQRLSERQDPPLLMASTLLVPGYIDSEEVGRIASFIANLDVGIPYALLGFAPHFFMPDLPRTSVRHATEAEAAARAAGLTNVWIGNRHMLSRD